MTAGLVLVILGALGPLACALVSAPWLFSYPLYALSAVLALVAYALLCLSPLLSGRYRLMEALGGIGRWYRLHMILPLFLVLTLAGHYLYRLSLYPRSLQTTFGETAFWLFAFGIASALLFLASPIKTGPLARLRERVRAKAAVPYFKARLVHNTILLVLPLAGAHLWFSSLGQTMLELPTGGESAAGLPLMRLCILAYTLGGLALGLWPKLRRRLLGKLTWLAAHNPAENVSCFDLQAPLPFHYRPGQYGFFRLLGKDAAGRPVNGEPHPFSFTRAPGATRSGICVKALGDYTRELPGYGYPAAGSWEGPFGNFILPGLDGGKAPDGGPGDLLMLAGGIGITPFLSWLDAWNAQPPSGGKRVLLWTLRHPGELFAQAELDHFRALPGCGVIIHYSQKDDSTRLDQAGLKAALAGLAKPSLYLCGPPGFVAAMRGMALACGIAPTRIHTEQFAL